MNSILTVSENWNLLNDKKYVEENPCDEVRLRQLVTGKIVVMGLHTWLNKGTLFTGRASKIYVLADKIINSKSCIPAYSVEELLDDLKFYEESDIFVVGGKETLNKLWEHLNTMYITQVQHPIFTDKRVPNLDDLACWELTENSNRICGNTQFCFKTYKKAS